MISKSARAHSAVAKVAAKISGRFWRVLLFAYNFVDRTILILGFIALCTGIITFGRFFCDGLAHWIKGGVFFWLGIFTLGRWAGCFGEIGWAWNLRPKQPNQKWRPSAEFAESFLIFFYGATNIFLEHLGNWGQEWSAQDLEHISITVLFIGGESYTHSTNPLPALVILLTGLMMSSHTQESMISSMVHKQWGNLLTAASFARALTYVLLWLRPPTSVLPGRPPTELGAAFGLVSGGVIFMASSSDTVIGMIHYQLDAMFVYTVTMGLSALLMAWVILVVAVKGWAGRREGKG
ncbi:hypothetical protein N0V88_006162 [Collariella sp. IMI 366227]|nr:hypothetical protein N0V88_006162 [Collariella sp. IMI 366227]